jgi:OmpA-OmpF porin, OOP family
MGRQRLGGTIAAAALATTTLVAQPPSAVDVDRPDLLTFAQGAVPVSITGAAAAMRAATEAAIRLIDGDPTPFVVVTRRAPTDTPIEIVYQLPAATVFDRFAVPNVRETPSPSQTFVRSVEIEGSPTGATSGFVPLAAATLAVHRERGQFTEIPVTATPAVRWVRVRLTGGLQEGATSLEMSEVVGQGTQEAPPMATRFSGTWRAGANVLRLVQQGPVVSGCYDTDGELSGTVTGTILRATGLNRVDRAPSAFVLSIDAGGGVLGVRSTNGGPFRFYSLEPAAAARGPSCGQPPPPTLGCGSVIHGIRFAFDSAELLPESDGVLAALVAGLSADRSTSVVIEGHTSSEGSDDYNRGLSERRARAVVAALVARGLAAARLKAAGAGETRPIADNVDEAGRSLNRRVEVRCTP